MAFSPHAASPLLQSADEHRFGAKEDVFFKDLDIDPQEVNRSLRKVLIKGGHVDLESFRLRLLRLLIEGLPVGQIGCEQGAVAIPTACPSAVVRRETLRL